MSDIVLWQFSDPIVWVVGYFFLKGLWLAIFPRGIDKKLRDQKREQLKRQAKL